MSDAEMKHGLLGWLERKVDRFATSAGQRRAHEAKGLHESPRQTEPDGVGPKEHNRLNLNLCNEKLASTSGSSGFMPAPRFRAAKA